MNARRLLRPLLISLSILAGIVALPGGARAAEPTETAVITGFSASGGMESYELSVEATRTPRTEMMLLQSPPRIVLDIFDTVAAARPPDVEDDKLVRSLRDGLISADRYRLIFGLAEPAVAKVTPREDEEGAGLQIELTAVDEATFAEAAAKARAEPEVVEAAPVPQAEGPRYTVVLDPGHGAEDLGAVGVGGTLEKDLNLAFAKTLQETLEKDEEVRVVMTRTTDVLLPLAERAAMARREGADLFVSLHADSIRYKELRGATIYTLSDRASDPLSQEVAEGENAADRFVGPEWEADTPEIHDILVDLVRRETEVLSERLASRLVLSLKRNEIRLINNPKRSAGFRVLRAPDVPSVLIEIGYLSNELDEKLMTSPEWQAEMAEAVSEAIGVFLRTRSTLAARP